MQTKKLIAAEAEMVDGTKTLNFIQHKYLPKGARRVGRLSTGTPLYKLPGKYKCS